MVAMSNFTNIGKKSGRGYWHSFPNTNPRFDPNLLRRGSAGKLRRPKLAEFYAGNGFRAKFSGCVNHSPISKYRIGQQKLSSVVTDV
jgi:hypothetical protein